MKPLLALSAFLFLVLPVSACAGAPSATQVAANTALNEPVLCREVLVIGSNQLRTLCGTEEQWERYDRHQAWSAEALTLRMQGSAYSGGY